MLDQKHPYSERLVHFNLWEQRAVDFGQIDRNPSGQQRQALTLPLHCMPTRRQGDSSSQAEARTGDHNQSDQIQFKVH